MKLLPTTALLSLILAILSGASPPINETNFIRVDQDDQEIRLQPLICNYRKGDIQVALFGAIHLADKDYYQDLNERFKKFDCILYEMIGGENKELLKEENQNTDHPLNQIYSLAARFLELSHQKDFIDYQAKNFIHADLTQEEFVLLQSQRGESLLSFAQQATDLSSAKQPSTEALMRAFLSGDPNKAKRLIVDALAQGDEAIAGLTGESVIITDRNAKCLRVLEAQITKGDQKLGVFYGAAHYPDFEKKLLQKGFKKESEQWLSAWKIPKS
jgi:hypothetical protein